MKANRKNQIWKAIAFLILSISLFSCTACDDNEPLQSAVVTVKAAENITTTSATIVALVTPNQDNTVISFEYKENNSAWRKSVLPTKFSGHDPIKVTLDLSDLKPATLYNFKVTATNAAEPKSDSSLFVTTGSPIIKAIVAIRPAENVKINSAKLVASVIPNEANTVISFEYQTLNSAWQTKTLPTSFSGKDSVKVTFDLSDLQANTHYNFRVKATNSASEVISEIISFTTYAVSDYDGNLYHTVTIGTQTWLKENLRATHYSNGDPISNVKDAALWGNLTAGAYCKYNNNDSIANIYGYLYNFYVSSDTRSLIVGYHVPVTDEWNTLAKTFGDPYDVAIALMEAGNVHWVKPLRTTTNSSGFTALPNGGIGVDKDTKIGEFNSLGIVACFWSSDVFGAYASAATIENTATRLVFEGLYLKTHGMGIRLVKN